ncbi:efflux RND transporter periplasmic adaptor subunit [Xanthomonas euvesicatoria]|uniref:efflux RND transporter periplasmic adaptor subunit n=1 Tax=Xanthomonas euvesicatoria TaxID=456327 RepID=UPI001C45A0BD|nr:efflux RND transporter periplasmic adaptor subunit [Xanthomonas euvesicatoria]MBV6898201.1 efflux RND transporter periplasmic adaptor subunit [Xanthomonas campestris pv. ionidii]
MNNRSVWLQHLRRYRWWLIAAAVLICGVLLKVFVLTSASVLQVATSPVVSGDIEETVLATGKINAAQLVSVGAQVTGQVVALHVKLGDTVRKGQPIAEIDALPQQNALRTARAQVRSAQARLSARLAALRQARLADERQRALLADDAVARADAEAAEATLATVRADIEALRAEGEQARIAASTAELNLSYTRVVAPMDGEVVAIVTEQGQTVNANQTAPTIIKLARLDTMTVKAQISEADVVRVSAGMGVYFTLLGEPDTRYHAVLSAVEPGPITIASDSSAMLAGQATAGASSTAVYFNGIFEVPNPRRTLRIDMTAQTTIVLASVRNARLIPSAALGSRTADGSYVVHVLTKDGGREMRRIRVGLDNRINAQVIAGLELGEQVITSELATPTDHLAGVH